MGWEGESLRQALCPLSCRTRQDAGSPERASSNAPGSSCRRCSRRAAGQGAAPTAVRYRHA